ncbi:MAG TPA: hemolysin family protein [Gaiellaceae bacterium]|nr:hemolysin family protein [Gaiellaceae bacterium]
MSDVVRVVALLALVAGTAVFAAAKYALLTARRTRLQARADDGSRSAAAALRLTDAPVGFIGTVQIGITTLALAAGAIGEPLLSRHLDDALPRWLAIAVSFLLLTYVVVTLGELVPKGVALEKADRVAVAVAPILFWLGRAAAPLTWLFAGSANVLLRILRVEPTAAADVVHTEEDIRQIVAGAEDAGEIESAEEEMLYKVFDFADTEVHEVMVPRPEVVALSADLPPEEALGALLSSPYTRYPVYRENLDHIIGILHVRDLFGAMHDRGIAEVELEKLVRTAYIVPETKDLAALLAEFRQQNQHMAVVVDEYGAMQGIVTLEDLLEEIVGEIEDEFDLPDESVERLDERRVRIDGTFPIDDFNEQFRTNLDVADFHTMAGLVFGLLGRAPEVGDEVEAAGLRLRVVEVEGSRIQRLEVEFDEAEDAGIAAAPHG